MSESVTFEVVGDQRIVCEGCEARIKNLLKRLEDVNKVRAKAQEQRIEVLFDASVLDRAAIAERLSQAGYQTRFWPSTSGLPE